jgi:hypothetical protein
MSKLQIVQIASCPKSKASFFIELMLQFLIVFSFFKKDEKNWGKWSKLNENGSLF